MSTEAEAIQADSQTDSPVDSQATVLEAVSFEAAEVESADLEASGAEAASGHEAPPQLASQAELPQILEALLLASASPLTMAQLKDVTELSADALSGALEQLSERYREGTSGIVLVEAAGAWALRTGERQKQFVRRLLGVKPQRLTRAALETLALVAYRQPITRPEIEDVRGVDCGAVLKALLERRLLKIIGKKEEPGRPLLYGTSKDFLEVFGLKSLTSLPTLREFQELSEESRTIVENETGPEEVAPLLGIEGLSDLADGTFAAKLEQNAVEDADALADLEAAMEEAEARARKLSEQMDPPEAAKQVTMPRGSSKPEGQQSPSAPPHGSSEAHASQSEGAADSN